MNRNETVGGSVPQRHTLGAVVWRRCSCGATAPEHGVNIAIATVAQARCALCPGDENGTRFYDGEVTNLGTISDQFVNMPRSRWERIKNFFRG